MLRFPYFLDKKGADTYNVKVLLCYEGVRSFERCPGIPYIYFCEI